MSNRTLVAYFSMTGNTQRLAQEVRAALGADVDVEEIREPHPRHGPSGMMRSLFDAVTRRRPPIESARRDPADYDLVVLGGPVWAGRMAPPVRTYARRYGRNARKLAFSAPRKAPAPTRHSLTSRSFANGRRRPR